MTTIAPEVRETPVSGYGITATTFGELIDERGHPLLVVFLRHYG